MILSQNEIKEMDVIEEWAKEAEGNGSRFPGMSYEEGIIATLYYIRGFLSAEEIMGKEVKP